MNMNDAKLICELTYINYKHNREISPNVTPKRWELVYGLNASLMEKRYTDELLAEVYSDDTIPYSYEA